MIPLAVGLATFCVAAVAYAAVAIVIHMSHTRTRQANWLVATLSISALWALASVYVAWADRSVSVWLPGLDAAHSAAWILFLAMMLVGPSGGSGVRLGRVFIIGAVALTAVVLLSGRVGGMSASASAYEPVFLALLALPLLGLLGLEQIFRNSDAEQREVLKPLLIGVAAIFTADVVVYSQALLTGEPNTVLWVLRGTMNAGAVPFILLAAKRHRDWQGELFVSRQVVFYTTSLIAAAAYLLAMGIGGRMVASSGHAWGGTLQLVFFVCAGVLFLSAGFSQRLRSQLKVFIATHFYRSRYDYRRVWLRLVQTLVGRDDDASLPERSVKALADIIGSPRGTLWMRSDSRSSFEAHGSWGMPATYDALSADHALVRFLTETHWIVDTREYAEHPDKYGNAFATDRRQLTEPSVFVPLLLDDKLIGIVRLDRPSWLGQLGFEDHDLLKTAGKQVAIFLAQERAKEELSQTRQFEAFSKLTSFLMHDLKNLIAQQELMVGNARRFKHRPEFVEDVVETIAASVRRMKSVLERLQRVEAPETISRIDLDRLLRDVCTACADRRPGPVITRTDGDLRVNMDRDKLNMAITHAVRNAQDATPADGRIELRLSSPEGIALIEVEDTGIGMDATFLRDHLFKPFDSTKGAKGMGIGAYQIRETVRAAGGDVEVESTPGKGTIVRLKLQLAQSGTAHEAIGRIAAGTR